MVFPIAHTTYACPVVTRAHASDRGTRSRTTKPGTTGASPSCSGHENLRRDVKCFSFKPHVVRQTRGATVTRNAFPNTKTDDVPMPQRALSGFLELPAVPIGSYVSTPQSWFHFLDPRVKQAWLVALLLLPPNGTPEEKITVCVVLGLVTAMALPTRVWRPQLKSLSLLCVILFALMVAGADSIAPVVQPREPLSMDSGLLTLPPLESSYNYVLFHFGPAQITRKGVRLAVSSACLTFTVLQSAHLVLCVTTPEAMAAGLRWYLRPLRVFRAPVDEIVFTLLLSLRFTSIVFEEVRNISLGLAARGVDWNGLGFRGAINVFTSLLSRALESLFVTSTAVADAVSARGYTGAVQHKLLSSGNQRRTLLNTVPDFGALLLLGVFVYYFADEGTFPRLFLNT